MSKESPNEPGTMNTTTNSTGYFEKQRDLLIQEISNSIDSVVYNLETLNRSLNESIQVGKEFDDVGKLWSHFYKGINNANTATVHETDEKKHPEALATTISNEPESKELTETTASSTLKEPTESM